VSAAGRGSGEDLASEGHGQERTLDVGALGKYGAAIGVQMALLTSTLAALDAGLGALRGAGLLTTTEEPLAFPLTMVLFGALALKSRAFNPLNNKRPDLGQVAQGGETKGFNDRTMPSWTPPGVVFPIMWVLIVAPLRAFAATSVIAAHAELSGAWHLCDPSVWPLLLHLSVGDTWNTCNNVERRLGAAVPGVACVWLSCLLATTSLGAEVPEAGAALRVTLAWISVAALLIADTWRVNNPKDGGGAAAAEPLYPYLDEDGTSRTEFAWGPLAGSTASQGN